MRTSKSFASSAAGLDDALGRIVGHGVLVRAGFGHAVAALRPGPPGHQLSDHLGRCGGSGKAEPTNRGHPLYAAGAHFAQQIDGVGRHAEQELRTRLLQPVEQAMAARQIVHHQLAAGRQRGNQRAEAEIVAQRAQRIEHLAIECPIASHHSRGGEQGVVAVHDPLRLSGRSGGEGQVHHLVRVAARRFERGRAGHIPERYRRIVCRLQPVRPVQEVAIRELREQVMPVGVGAVAGFGDQRRGAHAVYQGNDFADRVIAM